MALEPLSSLAREMLRQAATSQKGRPLKGRPEKQAARDLVGRGLGILNKSASRLNLTAAGHFVAKGMV